MMATSHNSLKVKVTEVCKVVPALPPPSTTTTTTTTTQISLPLTHFDCMFVRSPPTQRLFFYENTSVVEAATTILSNLKHSLSLTLQRYRPLAGKVTWPPEHDKPIIQYVEGDGGVPLTVAEAPPEAVFHHFTDENRVFLVENIFPLVPQLLSTHVETPALALQVTFFGGQGYSIGYTVHHAVADGKSISLFIHDWATTCRNIVEDNKMIMSKEEPPLNTLPPPSYDRSNIYDTTNVGTRYVDALLDKDGPNNRSLMLFNPRSLFPDLVRKTFTLTREEIDSIKALIKNQWELLDHNVQVHSPPLSTFTATVAHIWHCLVKSKNNMARMMIEEDQEFQFSISIDVRGHLQPPLPSTYFGNCVVQRFVALNFNDLVKEDGVAMAAKAIGEEIQRLKDGGAAVLLGPGVWNPELLNSPKGLLTTVAGSPRFEVYNVDFGWGKPRKVDMPCIAHSSFFFISDSRNGNGGLEVGIVLRKHQMEIFSPLFARRLT